MRFLATLLLLSGLLASCGGEWSAPEDTAAVTRCSVRDPLPAGRSVLRAAMSTDAGALYVLDDFSSIYRYTRDPARTCAWEIDASWQTSGQLNLNGFVEDLDLVVGQLFWMDGAAWGGTPGGSCAAERGAFAMAPGAAGFAVGNMGGIDTWAVSGSRCTPGTPVSVGLPVLALAQDGEGYYAVEGGATGSPERLSVYSRSGVVLWREPLSVQTGNEKYFCSASRLRSGNSGIFLLDDKCRRLGVFNSDGSWRKTLDLDSLGVRNALDVMPGEQGNVYLLLENQRELTIRLSSLLY